jgi:hypothetical protein
VADRFPTDYLDWSRDPRLVPDGIGCWDASEHTDTTVGMLSFVLKGRWSAAAFRALTEAMRVLLPTRHRFRVVSQGAFRVCVFLSAGDSRWPDEESAYAHVAVRRIYASLARAVAAYRLLPVVAPRSASLLPELSR